MTSRVALGVGLCVLVGACGKGPVVTGSPSPAPSTDVEASVPRACALRHRPAASTLRTPPSFEAKIRQSLRRTARHDNPRAHGARPPCGPQLFGTHGCQRVPPGESRLHPRGDRRRKPQRPGPLRCLVRPLDPLRHARFPREGGPPKPRACQVARLRRRARGPHDAHDGDRAAFPAGGK